MTRLVQSAEEACRMIVDFQWDAADVAPRLAHTKAWYAYQDEDGEWLFGPSKFIGYYKLSVEEYLDPANSLHGQHTETKLQNWFEVVPEISDLGKTLKQKLVDFLEKHGKSPSSAVRINILKDTSAQNDEEVIQDKVVDLMTEVAKLLHPNKKKALLKRIS